MIRTEKHFTQHQSHCVLTSKPNYRSVPIKYKEYPYSNGHLCSNTSFLHITEEKFTKEVITCFKKNNVGQKKKRIIKPRVIHTEDAYAHGSRSTYCNHSNNIRFEAPKKFQADLENSLFSDSFSSNTCTESESENTAHNVLYPSRMTESVPLSKSTIMTSTFHRDIYTGTQSARGSGFSGTGQGLTSIIRETREREKKEIADLNDRLANYIEKVRFLEAQNKKMETDLTSMKSRWGNDATAKRSICETKLKNSTESINFFNQEREKLEDELRNLMPNLAKLRSKIEHAMEDHTQFLTDYDCLLLKLCELETEINLYKRRIALLEEEISFLKKENQRVLAELSRCKKNIDKESLSRIGYQSRVQELLDECHYINEKQSRQMSELLVHAHRDTTPENREFFKRELASAIKDVREEYDLITSNTKKDMESWYRIKIEEIQTYSKTSTAKHSFAREEISQHQSTLKELRTRLCEIEGKNVMLEKEIEDLTYIIEDEHRMFEAAITDRDTNIRKLQDECQTLLLELQMLLDTKTTLDAEIAIYRKMLEGEENRAGLRQLVEQVVRTDIIMSDSTIDTKRIRMTESLVRTNLQKTSRGNINIAELSSDGNYILIQNNSCTKDEDMSGWKITCKSDKEQKKFIFPENFMLKADQSAKIFGRGHDALSMPDVLIANEIESWSNSQNVLIILYDKEENEKARLNHEKSGAC